MTQIAVNYAKALYELSASKEAVEESIQLLAENEALGIALKSPIVDKETKRRIIDRVFPREITGFIKQACDHRRGGILEEILSEFLKYSLMKQGVLTGSLRCAVKPEEDQVKRIKDILAQRFDVNEVRLETTEDAALMGGFVIRAGNWESDWSIKGRLEQLQQKLMGR